MLTFKQKLEKELEVFTKKKSVHDLPAIFHYWSHKYLKPKFDEMGIRGIAEFFADNIAMLCRKQEGAVRIFSIGAGHCETELQVCQLLVKEGHHNFQMVCSDINQGMLDVGRAGAASIGLAEHCSFCTLECSEWKPAVGEYQAVMANQSLHHITDLERLFAAVGKSIGEHGLFIVSDIIGCNGHKRWPEALKVVHEIWRTMPDRYKFNHALQRHEKLYENWDCSTEGFEGVRAEDILALLVESFEFDMFLAFGNIIDIFVDRAFGHNFDIDNPDDTAFIDMVAEVDERLLKDGSVKPTHLLAVMCNGKPAEPRYYQGVNPATCVRMV
jgi:SAM-dependent methyltransferase